MGTLLHRLDSDLDHDLLTAGPASTTHDHLRRGQRALRRRRTATAVAGLGLVGVLGLGAALWPATTSAPPVTSAPGQEQWFGSYGEAATVHPETGQLLVRPGWEVTREVADPIGDLPVNGGRWPADRSWGLVATDGEHTQYLLLWWRSAGSGTGAETHVEDPGSESLEAWLDVKVAQETRTGTSSLVTAAADGSLRALPGTEVVAQRPSPELGEGFTVARLEFEGQPMWVLVEQGADRVVAYPQVFPRPGDEQSLGGFLDFLKRTPQ